MGMDETLIGIIFTYPVLQANLHWLEELQEDGVPIFGVGRVLPTSWHIVCVEHHLAHILHPKPW
jgi:hypothetical protein